MLMLMLMLMLMWRRGLVTATQSCGVRIASLWQDVVQVLIRLVVLQVLQVVLLMVLMVLRWLPVLRRLRCQRRLARLFTTTKRGVVQAHVDIVEAQVNAGGAGKGVGKCVQVENVKGGVGGMCRSRR